MIRTLPLCIAAALALKAWGAVTDADAKRIALDHAGASEGDPRTLYVGPDTLDDDTLVYEVRFHLRGYRRVYIVDAETGGILSHSAKRLPGLDGADAPEAVQTDIGGTKAGAIAMADADVGDKAKALCISRRYKDGTFFYIISFRTDGTRYHYRIDATDGTVLERRSEPDDGARRPAPHLPPCRAPAR